MNSLLRRSQRCRRPAFLRACERISQYYRMESDDVETDVKETHHLKQLSMYESIRMLKSYLLEFDTLPSYGARIPRIRLAEKIFETILRSDELLQKNPGFRGIVYHKIDELKSDLDDYLDNKLKSIQKNVDEIQDTLSVMISTLPQCGPLSVRLQEWMTDLSKVEETDHHDYLRSLFYRLNARRDQWI